MFNPFETADDDNVPTFGVVDETPKFNEVVQPAIVPNSIPNSSPTNSYTKKYNIVDLYWLINHKLFVNEKLNPNECQLLILGYNADFNNLRVAFLESNAKTFNESSILKYEAKQVTSINIFSEVAQQIIYNTSKGRNAKISNFERIFSANMSGDWKPNTSQIEIEIAKQEIVIRTTTNNKTYSYTFLDWQLQAFLNALKFMVDGQAWRASLTISK